MSGTVPASCGEVSLRFTGALGSKYLGPVRNPVAERRYVAMRERARAKAAAQEADKLAGS